VRRFVATVLLLAGLFPVAAAAQSPGEAAARDAVDRFGRALTSGNVSSLGALLPQKGKVQLKLVRLGPEQGAFSASQVEALLRDFLVQGSVQTFKTLRVEHDPHGVAIASSRLDLKDKQGRPATVELHLVFQPEGERWVVREIRETPR
jgi:hypothetical protein